MTEKRISNQFIDYLNDNTDKFQKKGKHSNYGKKVAVIIIKILKASEYYGGIKGCLTHRVIFDLCCKYPEKEIGQTRRTFNDERRIYDILNSFDFFVPNKQEVYNPSLKKVVKTNDWRVNERMLKQFIEYEGNIWIRPYSMEEDEETSAIIEEPKTIPNFIMNWNNIEGERSYFYL